MTNDALRLLTAGLLAAFLLFPHVFAHDPNLNAIFEYNEILEKNPDDVGARKARGSTYRALEYFDSALEDLTYADRLVPSDPEVVGEIGMCHYHLGDWKAATEHLERAEELLEAKIASGTWDPEEYKPIDRELRDYLFHNYLDLERYEEALAQSEKLMEYLRGKISFQCDVADALLALGRAREALRYYEMAVEVSVTFERYTVGAANCYLRLNRNEDALKLLEAWKAEEPEAVLPLLHESVIRKAYLKDDQGAAAALARAERLVRARMEGEEYPDIEDLVHLVRILQQAGRYQEAWGVVEGLLDDYRAHWLIPYLQGVNARGLGREREADSFLKEATLYKRLNPADWLQAYEILEPEPPPAVDEGEAPESGSDHDAYLAKSWPYVLGVAAFLLAVVMLRRILK